MSAPYSYGSTAEAVNNYYAGSDGWTTISNAANMTESNAADVLSNTSNVSKMVNADGSVRAYTIDSAASSLTADEQAALDAAHAVDSNSGAGTAAATDAVSLTVPANAVSTTGQLSLSSSIGLTADTGVTVTGVLGTVGAAVAAVSAGIAMGQLVDSALYNANPDFWDSNGMSTLNPDTWSAITNGDTSAGAKIINALFHFDPTTKKSTMYIDENAVAYFTAYIGANSVFRKKNTVVPYSSNTIIDPVFSTLKECLNYANQVTDKVLFSKYSSDELTKLNYLYSKCLMEFSSFNLSNSCYNIQIYLVYLVKTTSTSTYSCSISGIEDTASYDNITLSYKSTQDSGLYKDYHYYLNNSTSSENRYLYSAEMDENYTLSNVKKTTTTTSIYPYNIYTGVDYNASADHATINVYGMGSVITKYPVDGISPAPNATPFNADGINDWTDINGILQAQHSQYPDLFNKAVTQNVPQPDGTLKPYTYVPCPMPQTDPDIDDPIADPQPVTSPATSQSDPSVDPDDPPSVTDPVSGSVGKTPTPNPPPSGVGTTPVVIPPTGSASALYTVYNPTQAQLNSFGAWLWSSSFADQILKLFSDPMQAIIGLHKIYCDPSVSGTSNIKVGYLDSGVSANVVSNQYTTVDCGSINLLEKFGNVFDYAPYTSVGLYLPFIGVVNLNVADVMRSSLNVVYHFDVLTGAIYVEVKVIRDSGNGGTIYTYSGNGASQYPLSSGSYMGIVSGIMSIAGGIAGTIASGGAAMPLMMGAASSAMNMHTNVERSGSITGNAGAMGAKIPYLIISRPQTAMADNYSKYTGVPANQEMRIGSASGFCKFLTLHLINITATDAEKSEIQNLFESGVLI